MGDLWSRERGRVYGADFKNLSRKLTYHGPINAHRWIIEVERSYVRLLFPTQMREEHTFQVGMWVTGPPRGFLRISPPFTTFDEAKDWALYVGQPGGKVITLKATKSPKLITGSNRYLSKITALSSAALETSRR